MYALVVFSALYYINRPRGPTDANAAVACVRPLVQLVHRGGGSFERQPHCVELLSLSIPERHRIAPTPMSLADVQGKVRVS